MKFRNRTLQKRIALLTTIGIMFSSSINIYASDMVRNTFSELGEVILEEMNTTTSSQLEISTTTSGQLVLKYDFDNYIEGNTISGTLEGKDAILVGKSSIIDEPGRGKVLNLVADGGLQLPTDLFANVNGENGFTISFDVKMDPSTARYSRMFNTSPYPFKAGTNGTIGGWNDNEIGIAGGRGIYSSNTYQPYDAIFYSNGLNKIQLNPQIEAGKWQNVVMTMKKDSFQIYVDNELAFTNADASGVPFTGLIHLNKSLQDLFNLDGVNNIRDYVHTYLGRSLYGSDTDFKGLIDNFTFEETYKDESYFLDEEDVTRLEGVRIKGIEYEFNSGYMLKLPVSGRTEVPSLREIEVIASVQDLGIEIKRAKSTANPTFEIEVTSKSGKRKATYYIEISLLNNEKVLEFDMMDTNHLVGHYGSGMLYGIAEADVPTYELISPIKPKVVEQKPPQGKQHPTGDGVRVADSLVEAGVEQIQIAVQDTYLKWPYDNPGLGDDGTISDFEVAMGDYVPRAVEVVRQTLSDTKNADKYVFVIFNEPDGNWFRGKFELYLKAHKMVYQAIKAEFPQAKIAGMNECMYVGDHWEKFIPYCIENDVLPEVMTWHELSDNSVAQFENHYEHYRQVMLKNNLEAKLDEIPVVVNEYAMINQEMGQGGKLIRYVARFEYNQVYGCLAYWHKANSMNELAADANKPNGAWWLYKWYGDMTGDVAALNTYNLETNGLYGLASINNDTKTAYTIFGGQEGTQTVALAKINQTEAFEDADAVHVKLYRANYTGFLGDLDTPKVEFEGNLAVTDGEVVLTVEDADVRDSFYAIITPATGEPISLDSYEKKWAKIYEAEDANKVNSKIYDQAYASAGKFVEMSANSSEVTFSIEVPQDGKYALDILYSNMVPWGQSRGQGKIALQKLTIDGEEFIDFYYDSTVNSNYVGSKMLYVDLKAGTHTLKFNNVSQQSVCIDRIELFYGNEMGKEYKHNYVFDANETEKQGDTTLFNVVVKEDGYYDLVVTHNDSNEMIELKERIVKYGADAKTETHVNTAWEKITDKNLTAEQTTLGSVYLSAGINQIQLITTAQVKNLVVSYNPELTRSKGVVVEAESGELIGKAEVLSVPQLPEIEVVSKVGESKENKLNVEVEVPEAGEYRMVVHYINNEPASSVDGYLHPYNVDLIERYAQIEVNGETPQAVHFINTLSWSTVKTKVIDVTLKAGKNTISYYNDNSYQFQGITAYAPNVDKFEFFPVYNEVLELSSACDIINIIEPAGAIKYEELITCEVESSIDTQKIDLEVSKGANWRLYSNEECTSEIADGTLSLKEGDNTAYVQVVAEDGTTKVYTVIITRQQIKEPDVEKSSECNIINIISPIEAIKNDQRITAKVDANITTKKIEVEVSKGATWGLYSDQECKNEIVDSTLALKEGDNTAYIQVVAEDGTMKVYTVVITRKQVIISEDEDNSNSSAAGKKEESNSTQTITKEESSLVIQKALQDNKIPLILVDKNSTEVGLAGKDILNNASLGNELIISNGEWEVSLTPNIVESMELAQANNLQISLKQGVNKLDKGLADELSKFDNLNKSLADIVYTLQIKKDSKDIQKTKEPIKIGIDVSEMKLTEKQMSSFSGIYFDEVLKTYKVLGGEFTDDGKMFEFYVNTMGSYSTVILENLIKVNLKIDSSSYEVNGLTKTSDVNPFISENRTMLPLRLVAETLNAKVSWDKESKKVLIIKDDKEIELQVGEVLPDDMGSARIVDNRTYVPIRYISEQLGANIVWSSKDKKVSIYK